MGFTLKETKELLKLKVSAPATCDDVKKKAEEKLDEIDRKIEGLQNIGRVLKDLIKACQSRQSTEQCPILRAIDSGEKIS